MGWLGKNWGALRFREERLCEGGGSDEEERGGREGGVMDSGYFAWWSGKPGSDGVGSGIFMDRGGVGGGAMGARSFSFSSSLPDGGVDIEDTCCAKCE